jgi:UDP-N-acetylmuramoyl-tripeptide--D-alanyl-D-alanine ligase
MNTLDQLLPRLTGARLHGQAAVQRVHTDTRTLRPGDLFVALRGERFDAHDFLAQARAAGAAAALAERGLVEAGLPGVEVPDSRQALGELAALWRQQFRVPLVAVTGSNGKTTVTQMIAAVLRAAVGDAAVLATEGNFNNDIGVPLMLLRLQASHRLAVLELGMNHPGEIAGLAAMAAPSVVLVNNAQREHQEFMATVEAVAQENGSALCALPAEGVAVFPADEPYASVWQAQAGGRRVLTFGESISGADVYAEATWAQDHWVLRVHTPLGTLDTTLAVAGRHNVRNALAASACALALGLPLAAVAQGLAAFEAVAGRSRTWPLQWGGHPLTLVDDSYNANPDSVRAAIEVLASLPAPRVLVLGDMGEVGAQGLAFHDEVLRHALAQGIDHVLVTGEWMAQASLPLQAVSAGRLRHCPAFEGLTQAVMASLTAGGSVLVKGSRFMRMERLVQTLRATASPVAFQKESAHVA